MQCSYGVIKLKLKQLKQTKSSFFYVTNFLTNRNVDSGRAVDGLGDVGVDPEDASNIVLVYLAEIENKLLQVKQVYY